MSKKAGRNVLFWCDDVNDGKKIGGRFGRGRSSIYTLISGIDLHNQPRRTMPDLDGFGVSGKYPIGYPM